LQHYRGCSATTQVELDLRNEQVDRGDNVQAFFCARLL